MQQPSSSPVPPSNKKRRPRERHLSVRSVRREDIDIQRYAKALISIAEQMVQREAAAKDKPPKKK